MERCLGLLLLLIGTSTIIHIVQVQSQQGFISLDCGLPANEQSPYKEDITGLQFSSDATYIKSGKTGKIQEKFAKPYTTLRYFPDGIRNCYNIPVEKGRKHLIRAWFVYGNYDGLNINPKFDLYLGPNLWGKIDFERLVSGTMEEILHIPTSNSLQICLVKNGTTTPLISTLELRPMANDIYKTTSGSLKLKFRSYLTNSKARLRYPDDIYDRQWIPYLQNIWTEISTTRAVLNNNKHKPPEGAFISGATPTNASAPLTIGWTSPNPDDKYYFYSHFAETQDLQANEIREFNIIVSGRYYSGPLIPGKLRITTIQSTTSRTCDGGKCSFQLVRTNKSTLPPLLNALEMYTVITFPQSETDESDVTAVNNIKATYGLSTINWQGDPCVPQQFIWDGLTCTNTDIYTSPRIITLNLSSNRLTGTIAAAIQNLTQLKNLDLSNNNLTGEVPEFLGNMKSLLVINLSGNDLNGSIPQSLQRKGLDLSFQGNPRLLPSRKRKSFLIPIVVLVGIVAILIVVLVLELN